MRVMRHSDPSLTAKNYTDANAMPLAGFVAKLPGIGDGDSLIDSHDLGAACQNVSQGGAEGGCGLSPQPDGAEGTSRVVSLADASCPNPNLAPAVG